MSKDKSKINFWQYHKPWTVTNLVWELGRIRIEQVRPTSHLEVAQYFEAIADELQKNSFNTVAHEE